MRKAILLVSAVTLACVVWVTALASAAGPSPGINQSPTGLTNGKMRYVTLPAGASTSVEAVNRQTGRVVRRFALAGAWGIPLVAYDGTTEGLLADGHTLLLAQPLSSGPTLRGTTTFKLVDVRKMKVAGTVRLHGAFAFDARSPDGRYLYLTEFVSPEDPSLYRVRAYDLRKRTLLAKIVTDRKSWETGMRGVPVTRSWTDGWAFTLYGGGDRPFIHALDTAHVEAVCIFMPWKTSPEGIFDFRLGIDGDGHLVVRGPHGRALVVIDRDSFRVLRAVENP